MKKLAAYILTLVFTLLYSCETEHEVYCFPQRVKTTLAVGTNATSVTHDYKYSGDLVDRIIMSNSQTHYFTYNEDELLIKEEEFDIKALLKTEYRITYDGIQPIRLDRYISRLNYLTQEAEDTTYVGYHTFIYEGANITQVDIYGREDESQEFEFRIKKEYTYDDAGNISGLISNDMIAGGITESYTFTFDLQKNPYNALNLYFNGESFVNNILEKVDHVNNETYTYQIIYNASQYPDQINVKNNGYLYQVITFDYTCK